ncbi:MAG: hypothetical protein J0H20_02125 [Rhizobiales bacterium]|nr:hypothetical protein [Hyphomicrobiales bacterium]
MSVTRHPLDPLALRIGAAAPPHLLVLLHGVGAMADDLLPVAQMLCATDESRACILLGGPDPFSGGGPGRQWFSIVGVTEANRGPRVAEALSSLTPRLAALAAAEGIAPADLALLGFSQGAILTLAMAAAGQAFGHGIALAGRFGGPVGAATAQSPRLLLSHGADDRVIPIAEGRDAAARFQAAGFDTAFLPLGGLGHSIAREQVDAAVAFLAREAAA